MTSLLSYFDTEADAPSSRRDALGTVGKLGLGAAIAAIPFLDPRAAYAQGAGPNQVDIDGNGTFNAFDILNYALTLEYLERSFYRQGLDQGYLGTDRPLIETIELVACGETNLSTESVAILDGLEEPLWMFPLHI